MAHVAELIDILRRFGISAGDGLIFEASGEEMQSIEGGLETLASALQDLIEPNGTLVVPTCTPAEGYPKPTFDPALSPSEMGPFSEFFRKQPGVLRSHSPTHSVAARGSIAEELVAGHRSVRGRPTPWGEGPFGKGSPWDVLYEHNAWWVLVDANWRDTPFTAYVQALYAERHSGITKRTPFPRFNAEALGQKLEHLGLLHQATWGPYKVVALGMHAAVDAALQTLEENPEQLEPDEEFHNWLATVDYIKCHGYLQAGVAKAVITPTIPCLRWEGKQFTGVYRGLYARVVVLSHRTQQIALVLCDLLGITGELVNEIRQKVQENIGFPAEAIQIACTHSHSTPDTIGSGYEDPEYLEFMVGAIVGAICNAATNTQPARMGWGRAPIRGLACSRRIKMTDGKVFTTRYGVPSTWRVKPELIASKGQIDPDLTVIRIETLDGKVLAAISNFGCHASVALMSPNISGDFPGEAMALLENVLGEPTVVLCTNGAAGDVDPTLEMPFWGPRKDAMARHLGRIFAAQVLECLERIEVEDKAVVGASREFVDLEVRPDWISLLEVEQERMRQEFAEGWSLSTVTARTLQEKVIHTEVQALRLNDLILVGFPGEVFAHIGLKLKSETPNCAVAVVELANDNVGYIATPEAFSEGGYEVGQHLWGRVTPEAAGILLAAARRLMNRLMSDNP
jgi:hypothetical protein